MREAILVLVLVAIGWLGFNFTKKKPANERDKESFFAFNKDGKNEITEISLKELSAIWTCHNIKKSEAVEEYHINENIIQNCDNTVLFTELDDDTLLVEEDADQTYYQDILKGIGKSVNVANDKGVYEIFSLTGTVYVHTSGLNKIIKQLTKKGDKEAIKEKVKTVSDRFIEAGIAPEGFLKYRWESFEGRRGKSLYMAIPAEFLPDGTMTEDTSNIKLMEKEND